MNCEYFKKINDYLVASKLRVQNLNKTIKSIKNKSRECSQCSLCNELKICDLCSIEEDKLIEAKKSINNLIEDNEDKLHQHEIECNICLMEKIKSKCNLCKKINDIYCFFCRTKYEAFISNRKDIQEIEAQIKEKNSVEEIEKYLIQNT